MSAVNMLRRLADQRGDEYEEKEDDVGETSARQRPANFTPAPTLNIRMAKSDRGHISSARLMSGRDNFGIYPASLDRRQMQGSSRNQIDILEILLS